MTGAAIALVLLSAALHASWNYFNKGSRDRWAFFLGQGVLMVLIYAPLFLWRWRSASVDQTGWLCLAASAATHAAYAIYLLKSYDAGDLSVAYPLSRTAPLLVAAWDMVMVRGQLTLGGVSGVMLAGIGALTLQLPAVRARGTRAVLADHVTRYALLTAVFIAAFTIVDKEGVRHVHPFIYLYLTAVGEFSLVAMRLGQPALARVVAELRSNGRAVLFTAIVGPFSYLLILWVLRTAPASYVLGLRQTSIVFGVLLGRFLLGEGETAYRLTGATIIAIGGLLIALTG
jgi:uncharacterized membrane protein